jgi:hypothetical protein
MLGKRPAARMLGKRPATRVLGKIATKSREKSFG